MHRRAERLRRLARRPQPRRRDLDLQFGQEHAPGLRILDAREQLPRDAEGRGHHAAAVAGVDPLGEDLHPQRSRDDPAQRSGAPELLVVPAARVEADHQGRRADPILEVLDIGGQVGRAALLAGLDQHHAARARQLLGGQDPQRGQGRKGRVAIVGGAAAVEALALAHRRPRREPLAPAAHLGLLVEVSVEEDRLAARARRGSRRGLHRRRLGQDHRRAPLEPHHLDAQSLERLPLAERLRSARPRGPSRRARATAHRTRASGWGCGCSRAARGGSRLPRAVRRARARTRRRGSWGSWRAS